MDQEHTNPTLRELRELRGLTLEELAHRSGVPLAVLKRLEDIGLDAAEDTARAERMVEEYLEPVMEALDTEGLRIAYAPASPEPGQLVIESPDDQSLLDYLIEHASALDLRMAVPTAHGVILRKATELSQEDLQGISDYQREEVAHHQERHERYEAYTEFMEGHGEDTTLGEALDIADEALERDLDRLNEGEERP